MIALRQIANQVKDNANAAKATKLRIVYSNNDFDKIKKDKTDEVVQSSKERKNVKFKDSTIKFKLDKINPLILNNLDLLKTIVDNKASRNDMELIVADAFDEKFIKRLEEKLPKLTAMLSSGDDREDLFNKKNMKKYLNDINKTIKYSFNSETFGILEELLNKFTRVISDIKKLDTGKTSTKSTKKVHPKDKIISDPLEISELFKKSGLAVGLNIIPIENYNELVFMNVQNIKTHIEYNIAIDRAGEFKNKNPKMILLQPTPFDANGNMLDMLSIKLTKESLLTFAKSIVTGNTRLVDPYLI